VPDLLQLHTEHPRNRRTRCGGGDSFRKGPSPPPRAKGIYLVKHSRHTLHWGDTLGATNQGFLST